jgi:predicted nucleic acid-binding protein
LIARSRDRRVWPSFARSVASGRFWLSSVAIAELYAGTRSREDALMLDRLVAVMHRIERVLTPTADEWHSAGQLLARRVRQYGPLHPRDHLADVLILVSAARIGGTIVTANVRHFEMWASLAASAGLDVRVTSGPEE